MATEDQRIPLSNPSADPIKLPIEVEVYINSDGSVTFADLASDVMPIASMLDPDQPLACDVPHLDKGKSSQ